MTQHESVSLKDFVQVQVNALSKEIDTHKASNAASALLLEDRIDRLNTRITTIESKAMGRSDSWAFFVAAAGMVMAGIGTFAYFVR